MSRLLLKPRGRRTKSFLIARATYSRDRQTSENNVTRELCLGNTEWSMDGRWVRQSQVGIVALVFGRAAWARAR